MKDYVENVVMVHDVFWAEGWGFESQSNRMLLSSLLVLFSLYYFITTCMLILVLWGGVCFCFCFFANF